jgi:TetR/AcrR family transcriptional regulator
MARPKTEEPEARAKIIAAAEELFAAHGFSGTSVRDIAKQAGVTGAMVHYYFGSKEGLYQTILEHGVAKVRAIISQTAESPAPTRERLAHFIEAEATYILHHPNLARIILREMLAGGEALVKVFRKYSVNNYALLRGIIRDGVERNDLRQLDIELAPISLMGMIVIFQAFRPVISVALNRATYDEAFIKRVALHTADLYLNGAQNPPGKIGKAVVQKARKGGRRKTVEAKRSKTVVVKTAIPRTEKPRKAKSLKKV